MISKRMKQTGLFVVIFVLDLLPMYFMGLSGHVGLLVANVVVAFVMASIVASIFLKND